MDTVSYVTVYRVFNISHKLFMQGDWETKREADTFRHRNGLLLADSWETVSVREIRNPQWND